MYKNLGIRIVLVQSITWSAGNKVKIVKADIEQTLDNFMKYAQATSTNPKDAIILLSYVIFGQPCTVLHGLLIRTFSCRGIVFTDGSNGIAVSPSVCDPFSMAVVRDRDILYQTSSTAAHEIGHTLGLDHDNDISRYYLGLAVKFLQIQTTFFVSIKYGSHTQQRTAFALMNKDAL